MQWSVKAAMTVLHSGQAFRLCKISATVHAQSRPIRLQDKKRKDRSCLIITIMGVQNMSLVCSYLSKQTAPRLSSSWVVFQP